MNIPLTGQIRTMIDSAEIDLLMATELHVPRHWGNHGTPHVRNFCKLYLIKEGRGFIRMNGQTHYPVKGDLVLIPQGYSHDYGVLEDLETYHKYYAHFILTSGSGELFHHLQINPVVSLGEDFSEARDYFTIASRSDTHRQTSFRLRQRTAVLNLFALFMEKAELGEKESSQRWGGLIGYIEENLDKKIDLKELAGQVNLEKSYFVRLFHKTMDMAPLQYVNRRRLEKACELLNRSDLGITEIAMKCGYSSLFYFSQVFKSRYDLSPRAYRQQSQGQSRHRASSNS